MKNFIIIAFMLFTFIGFSQNEFVGQWSSAIEIIDVYYKNDSLIAEMLATCLIISEDLSTEIVIFSK